MNRRHLTILRTILSQPVSPFHERAVMAEVRRWAGRRGVPFSRDAAGNVVLRCRRGRRRGAPWVFTAHMDHPGFVTTRRRGREVWAHFRGHVGSEYVVGSRVRLFAPRGEVCATIASRRAIQPPPWWSCRMVLDAPAVVPAGTVGMWDLPAFRRRGRRLSARACDDLAGAAAVVCALDRIAAADSDANVIGLLTRAEEAGFVGALAACRLGTIPPGALVVGIEASKAQPGAPLGGGVVLRVGDRARTFDAALGAHISGVAAALARRRKGFSYTRQLMPGGTCESMVFCLFGHRAAALALPLGNYHNMGRDGRIRPERIDLGDFASLVDLLAALAAADRDPDAADAALRQRLTRLLDEREHFLEE